MMKTMSFDHPWVIGSRSFGAPPLPDCVADFQLVWTVNFFCVPGGPSNFFLRPDADRRKNSCVSMRTDVEVDGVYEKHILAGKLLYPCKWKGQL
jgi:hypothetical protein